MKIRRDALAGSSVLFTFALLMQTPAMLANVWTVSQTELDIAHHLGSSNYYAFIGFASLAIIVIGLIVTWAGYIKGVRWTWLVMLVIAWGWVFPILIMPEFHWRNMLPIGQWPPLRAASNPRVDFAESVVTLLLMVLALALPVKRFVLADHRWDLKIPRGAVAVSAILFTLALVTLTPAMLDDARTTYETRLRDIANVSPSAIANQVVIPNWYAPAGITSLAIIAMGLIVIWAGYVKGVRWTWLVMFVIVWVWAFPVLILPFSPFFNPRGWGARFGGISVTQVLANTFASAIHESGPARDFVEVVLIFLLMVLALVLPVKTFIRGQAGGPGKSGRTNWDAASG
ncbi:MAG TPA: hypothetical protein VG204_23710 [Terriglobia bacterium]|nr:hypothetical protein [Terriglobia bacterium]